MVTMHMVRVCTALVQVQTCVRGRGAVCAWWVHVTRVSTWGICVLVSGLCVICVLCVVMCVKSVHMCALVCEVCV